MARTSVIIPAYNEADVIARTVAAVRNIPGVDRIVVVDDGSSDGTADAAREAGADEVIRLEHNLGKGGALNAALQAVDGDILLLLDADLGDSAREGESLLDPVLRGEADMAVARFVPSTKSTADGTKLSARSGGFGTVMKTARLGVRLMTGKTLHSPLAGPRALKREIVERAGGFAPKFGVEVALGIDALRMGYSVIEVPVSMVHRASGRDLPGFAHRGRQLLDVIRALSRKALRR